LMHGPAFDRLITHDVLLKAQLADGEWARRWLNYSFCP